MFRVFRPSSGTYPTKKIFMEISNKNLQGYFTKKNLHGGIQQKSSGTFQQKSLGRYSTKIFRFIQQKFGRHPTKIFRDVFNKNLQGCFQQKALVRYSTKIFLGGGVFDKESSLLNSSWKMAEKG